MSNFTIDKTDNNMWKLYLNFIDATSRKFAVPTALAVDIAYIIIVTTLYAKGGPAATAIVLLPVAVGSWLFGLRIGLIHATILILINIFIFYIMEKDIAIALDLIWGFGSLSILLIATVMGSLHNMLKRMKNQAEELKREQLALESEIIEHKYTEAQLEKSNQALDQFAYIVSHDLKAPLRGIDNLSSWIEEDMGDNLPEEVQTHLNLMRQRVQKMHKLIDGILNYSRSGQNKDSHKSVDAGVLLQEIVDELQVPPNFTITIGNDMPSLFTEEVQLGQVFSNLINNALKYHDRSDGHIEINAQIDGDFYQFVVSDDGPGIAAEYHQHIFELFQTANTHDTIESTGIGLAITKKIVEEQGGSIWLESSIGNGSTFSFTWPRNSVIL